jgi:uncharacterized protein (DUF342 family)
MNSNPEQPAAEVRIEEDATVAKVVIPAECDPRKINETLLVGLVRQHGIAVDKAVETRLRQIVESFRKQPRAIEGTIVRSTAPVDGEDGRLEWVKGFDPTAGPTAASDKSDKSDDSNGVDYYNQISYVRVAEGTHVATIHEPTAGEDGRDVTGQIIKARPGRRCNVRIDSSLVQDGTGRVVARRDGILEFEHRVIKVSRMFEVRGSVDFATGNIDFDGTVVVREGVRDRFKLKATEDVIVDGLIEAADVTCGGNFTCHRGMAAKGRGHLIVAGDAEAGYLDDVKGRIKGNLTVHREMINCELAVDGQLICDKGTMIGGEVTVSGGVRIAALGSNAGRPTTLILVERAAEGSEGEEADGNRQASVVDVLIHKAIYPGVSLRIGDVEVKFDVALKGPIRIGRDEHERLVLREGDGAPRSLDAVAKIIDRAA